MKKSVYQNRVYNATTIKYPVLTNQICTPIVVNTPEAMGEQKAIQVLGLWDTGATGSCISKKYADELGLKPVEFRDTYGVGGSIERVPVYEILIDLNKDVKNIRVFVGEARLHREDGGPSNSEIGFLIGMDIISHGDFFVGRYKSDTNNEKTIFSFRIPSACDPVDYLQEVRAFNREMALQQQKENKQNFLKKRHR